MEALEGAELYVILPGEAKPLPLAEPITLTAETIGEYDTSIFEPVSMSFTCEIDWKTTRGFFHELSRKRRSALKALERSRRNSWSTKRRKHGRQTATRERLS